MIIEFLVDFNRGRADVPEDEPWKSVFESVRKANQRDVAGAWQALEKVNESQPEVAFAVHLVRGRLATLRGDLKTATEELDKAETLCPLHVEVARAAVAHRRSVVKRLQSRLAEAIALGLKAEDHYLTQHWELDAALAGADVGLALIQKGDLGAGIETLVRVSEVIKKQGTPTQLTAIQANLATAMQRSGDMKGAERLIMSLLHEAPFNAPSQERAALLQNLAVIQKLSDRFAAALKSYAEALSMVDEEIHAMQVIRIRNGMADLHYRLHQYDEMKALSDALMSTPNEILESSPTLAIELALVRFRRFAIDRRMTEAMHECNVGRSIALQHRLWEEHDQLLVGALEYVRDTTTREGLLAELAKIRGQRLSSVSAMVTTVVDQRARYEQERAAQERARQQERAQVIMETQERTMEEIGRDLHDSIGNDLTVARRRIEFLQQDLSDLSDVQKARFDELLRSVEQASTDARRISHMLAAPGLDGAPIETAVVDLLESAATSAPEISFTYAVSGKSKRVPSSYVRTVYRCLQSLLQNLMRHAQATMCEVRIGVHEDELVVTIDDNGCGFEPKLVVRGLGLRSVQARVAAHGGRVMVDSSPGRGAFVSLHLPLGHTGEGNVNTDSDLSH